ncbi:hypothetical protein BC351_28890 [Paenibacillus ferrarius]|uniref:Uncharacterized protein n=1 Tax=Paenibacillus ferrarius TaxID=1469647 RepID=A0A1V4HI09_9BACL|nr:hypothetical protein [Paenibacillus ferrarius]OPH56187.1 hypothetical protein BC351_28890 [Paenibacillus ferrarius]
MKGNRSHSQREQGMINRWKQYYHSLMASYHYIMQESLLSEAEELRQLPNCPTATHDIVLGHGCSKEQTQQTIISKNGIADLPMYIKGLLGNLSCES